MGAVFRISDIVRSCQLQKQYYVAAWSNVVPWQLSPWAKKSMNLVMSRAETITRAIENSDI
ncbi:hypothetical protein [Mesorhizobium sp. Pch-S]|uniref:hypothetical protein n=1 Tax=Mesorhizobium sp. Pch-S TaxID=2082387 RepID=UPI001FE15F6D|nr:hypothetical protein [Mesorhizobium sp. Pch-S]